MARGRAAGYDDQREAILQHAATLFARSGYPATSMNQVAEACGLSKATLYHYYRDKYAMLVEIAEGHVTRLHALVDEHLADSDEARRTRLRHRLARRLLDDPVVYAATLDAETLAYFSNQRGTMAARLSEAAGLVSEQRAEGLALVDEAGELTDVAMPAEGTEAHATLLVAEFLAGAYRRALKRQAAPREALGAAAAAVAAPAAAAAAAEAVREQDIVALLRKAKESHGQFWRKSARGRWTRSSGGPIS